MLSDNDAIDNASNHSHGSNISSCRVRRRSDDFLEKYVIVKHIGEGSMGFISKAKIKSSKIGGSAYHGQGHDLMDRCGCFGLMGWFNRKYTASRNSKVREGRRDGEIYYALKTILMSRICPEFIDELRNEIEILKELDHPNIVKAFEVFERKEKICIVMELCSGGDLYTRLPYSERDAAEITAKLCSAIAYMHSRDVVHRDLKFENIMFENSSANSEVKIIDFGLSKKFLPGEKDRVMTEGVGTMYTMAPQVIKGEYTSQADLWSLGVITFMLLASEKPFYDRRRHRMMELIKSCSYSFDSPVWDTLSKQSKDFIRKLIVYDPNKRMDAATALKHPWFSMKAELSDRRPDDNLMEKIQNNLLAYRHTSTLKKVALNVIAHKSSPMEIYQLRRIFCQYDSSNDGTISFDEFKQALKESQYTDKELEEIFSSIDVNADGVIMYTEFLAATLEVKGMIEEERIADAFDRLDVDQSGFISPGDLRDILCDYTEAEIQALIAEIDADNDGQISFEEFKKIFRRNNQTLSGNVSGFFQNSEHMQTIF